MKYENDFFLKVPNDTCPKACHNISWWTFQYVCTLKKIWKLWMHCLAPCTKTKSACRSYGMWLTQCDELKESEVNYTNQEWK